MAPPGELGLIDGILGKPFDFDQVSSVITRLAAHPRVAEQKLANARA